MLTSARIPKSELSVKNGRHSCRSRQCHKSRASKHRAVRMRYLWDQVVDFLILSTLSSVLVKMTEISKRPIKDISFYPSSDKLKSFVVLDKHECVSERQKLPTLHKNTCAPTILNNLLRLNRTDWKRRKMRDNIIQRYLPRIKRFPTSDATPMGAV